MTKNTRRIKGLKKLAMKPSMRHAEYKQRLLNEITGKALRKHVINLYSCGISQVGKIINQLQQDTENGTITRDKMTNSGCLLVCTFGTFLVPFLVAAHTVNNLDLGHEQNFKNEGYESN